MSHLVSRIPINDLGIELFARLCMTIRVVFDDLNRRVCLSNAQVSSKILDCMLQDMDMPHMKAEGFAQVSWPSRDASLEQRLALNAEKG